MSSTDQMGRTLDAAYAIGHRLRVKRTPTPRTGSVVLRLERVRGEALSEFAEMTVDEQVILSHPQAEEQTWIVLASRILGDDLMRQIDQAQQHLDAARDQGWAELELIGGHADGKAVQMRCDAGGWPLPLYRVPVPVTASFMGASSNRTLPGPETADYDRKVMNPETGVWRYEVRD